MKLTLVSLYVATGLLFSSGAALAQSADDKKWVSQCIMDNKNEGASPEVVFNYCVCMNDKMDETETRSITQWEKANPEAMKDCERRSGWK
jgi:hypothetical protein